MINREIKINVREYNSISELESEDINLIDNSKRAALSAYSPYSLFKVGAAVLLDNNIIITGNNQENAAYPSGLCAERVALFYANAQYPDIPIKAIAISAFSNNIYLDNPIPPCGSCRQVLKESEQRFNMPIKVILYGEKEILVINTVSDLLPITFDNSYLK